VHDALFFRLRNVVPWPDLPDGFGPWRTIYDWLGKVSGAIPAPIGESLQKQDPTGRWHACGGTPMRPQSLQRSLETGEAYEGKYVIPLLEAPESQQAVG